MEKIKYTLDVVSFSVATAAILKILPAIAAVFSIVWLGIQIHDRLRYGRKK